MNYYSHHIGDYRRDTAHLSLLEHGVYRQLLDMYYLSEEPIPEETEVVFRRLCARTEEEKNAVITILKEFFKIENGWSHKRCDEQIHEYKSKAERARTNGKLGGRPSKTKEVILDNQEVSEEKANHKPITINHKPVTNKTKKTSPPDGEEKYSAKDDLIALGVPSQFVDDWLALRKLKKAPPSKTAIDSIKKQVEKSGMPLASAIELCCARGWAGFNAEWVLKSGGSQAAIPQSRQTGFDSMDYSKGVDENGRF